ncbi:E3 ubiquitin-protein ligase rad18 [Gnomoniopsis sp. IMI 355080]|nr:E3 ubiquitin-protein ligase rad18 [Gnomoniopsis sp. IMI 355080]
MTVPVSKDDGYDVSDPSDWLGTPLSSLREVEQSLRCHVCKDFFNSPMITSCSHTFCSLCIRRALNTDGKCPLCRTTDQESKLRGNWAIREAAEAFMHSRKAMLDLARQPTAPAATPPKRKADNMSARGESANKRTRMSTRSRSMRSEANAATSIQEEANELDAEEQDEYIPDDGLSECPICLWRMKAEKVDRHLDTDCPGEPTPQPNPSKSTKFGFTTVRSTGLTPGAHYERLPSTNYSLLNESKLRKKLAESGIPNWGNKLLMEKRHKEWVMIWNANCDSARPRPKRELLHDLDTWERTQGGHASNSSASVYQGAQVKDKDFDGAGWSTKHNDSFNDLIAQARRSTKKIAEKARQLSPSVHGSEKAETPHTDGADSNGLPTGMETDEAQTVQTLGKSATPVDLTSSAKFDESQRESLLLSGDEHANVDTVVSSAIAGAHT